MHFIIGFRDWFTAFVTLQLRLKSTTVFDFPIKVESTIVFDSPIKMKSGSDLMTFHQASVRLLCDFCHFNHFTKATLG